MEMNVKQRIASGALALALLGGTGASVAAQQGGATQRGGAAGVVAAVVQAADTVDVNNSTIEVVSVDVSDSFNNLRALNNVLNNSPILSQNDIDVTVGDVSLLNDVLTVGDVTITLTDVQVLTDFLNNNNIALDDVIGVAILSGGDLVLLT